MESPNSKEGYTGFLGFSGEEVLAGNVQRDPAGERDASLEAFLASCSDQSNASDARPRKQRQQEEKSRSVQVGRTCLAAFPGDAKNAQHGSDMIDEREASGLTEEFVLPSFCGDGVSCCCCCGNVSSSQCRGLMRRGVVSMLRLGRGRFLLPPRGGRGDREAEKTNDGVARPKGVSDIFLAAAEDEGPI